MINGQKQNTNLNPNFKVVNIRTTLLKKEKAITSETLELYPIPMQSEEKRTNKINYKITIVSDISKNIKESQKQREISEELSRKYEEKVRVIVDTINKETVHQEKKLEALYNWFLNNVFYWETYPRERKIINGVEHRGIKGTDYYVVSKEGISYSYPYNTKECAIVKGFSICSGIADAFKDIARRLGIDVEQVFNNNHSWNMVYTSNGPLYIDVAQAVRHFNSDSPEIRVFNKKEQINTDVAENSYLKPLGQMYNLYSHENATISDNEYSKLYNSVKSKRKLYK